MKHLILILFVSASCLISCSKKKDNPASEQSSGGPDNPEENPVDGPGDGQAITVEEQVNTRLHVKYNLPSNFSTNERPEAPHLYFYNEFSNQFMDVKVFPTINSKASTNLEELLENITNEFPGKNWEQQERWEHGTGYVAVEQKSDVLTHYTYFLLYDPGMAVRVRFYQSQDSTYEQDVFDSLQIDFDDPVVTGISLGGAEIPGGGEVAINVQIEETHEVITQYEWPEVKLLNSQNVARSWVGYNMPHLAYPKYSLAYYAYIKEFEKLVDNNYQAKVQLPENAPAGELVVGGLVVRDDFGRETFITLEPEADAVFLEFSEQYRNISGSARSSLGAAKINVVSDYAALPNFGNDIEVTSAKWETTFIDYTWGGITQSILVETNSTELIYNWDVNIQKRLTYTSGYENWSCMFVKDVEILSPQTYRLYIQLDDPCWEGREYDDTSYSIKVDLLKILTGRDFFAAEWMPYSLFNNEEEEFEILDC